MNIKLNEYKVTAEEIRRKTITVHAINEEDARIRASRDLIRMREIPVEDVVKRELVKIVKSEPPFKEGDIVVAKTGTVFVANDGNLIAMNDNDDICKGEYIKYTSFNTGVVLMIIREGKVLEV